jgi:hypothetical protein
MIKRQQPKEYPREWRRWTNAPKPTRFGVWHLYEGRYIASLCGTATLKLTPTVQRQTAINQDDMQGHRACPECIALLPKAIIRPKVEPFTLRDIGRRVRLNAEFKQLQGREGVVVRLRGSDDRIWIDITGEAIPMGTRYFPKDDPGGRANHVLCFPEELERLP